MKEHLKKKGGDALKRHLDAKEAHKHDTPAGKSSHEEKTPAFTGCPGQRIRSIMHRNEESATSADNGTAPVSQLSQWPVQIKLAPINAPYFDGANLLIAADCTAYAYADFHNRFIRNRITLIGCPKLDAVDYTEKLTSIIAGNDIKSVTIVRMEVPCCGGLEYAAKEALKASGKFIPWQVVTVNIDGSLRK
ncbi:4Fe-4S binding domain protein [Dorea sp. CAG:105]|nr:4Fe-4S binding domain protein [Dorea sp. CAG:105]